MVFSFGYAFRLGALEMSNTAQVRFLHGVNMYNITARYVASIGDRETGCAPAPPRGTGIMLRIQNEIEQLEALANEAELLSCLACDRDTRDHNRQLAIQFCAAVLRFAAGKVRQLLEIGRITGVFHRFCARSSHFQKSNPWSGRQSRPESLATRICYSVLD
jgi:hypothetical protein